MFSKEEKEKFRQGLKLRIYIWSVRLVKYCRKLGNIKDRAAWVIVDQLIRSGTSVCANYIEAIASPSTKDFRKFLGYSLKSGNESKFWLCLIRDIHIDPDQQERDWLLKEIVELSNILGKSVSTMQKSN
ncbi:MAG: four helix bundle protein [Patescibacteria group bacterium]